jgi:iron transport multicopper oxidase
MQGYATQAFFRPTTSFNNAKQGQYVDGLRAPLVIHPPTEAHSYDNEYTILISDWYHKEHSVLLKEFISPSNPNGVEPIPGQSNHLPVVVGIRNLFALTDSGLIYFVQNGSYLAPIAGTNPSPVGFNENATLPFEPGKTYRLRIINMGTFAAFFVWIDGHNMTIIEADGVSLSLHIDAVSSHSRNVGS